MEGTVPAYCEHGTGQHDWHLIRRDSINTEKYLLTSVTSVRLSECTGADTTGRIFAKLHTGDFYESLSRKSN